MELDLSKITPMMQQYLEVKNQYKDCILFYRLGDFYEMFFDDAVTASKELELTLTGRNCGLEERAPMCGVPYHAVDSYLSRLVRKGYKVAICEQMEDPKLAKGLVKREIVRIVTPGTDISEMSLEEGRNHFLMGIVLENLIYGIATVDLTTGEFYVTEVAQESKVLDEIEKFSPSEIICNEPVRSGEMDLDELHFRLNIAVSTLEEWYTDRQTCERVLKDHFHVSGLGGLGLGDYRSGLLAAGAVMNYLLETQKNSMEHIRQIHTYETGEFMVMDSAARRNLELTETLREKLKRGSLLWVLDKTKTAMGARLMRSYLEQPLIDAGAINARYDAIDELNAQPILRDEIREYLGPVYDLERLMGRVSLRTANARDFIALSGSLAMIPPIKMLLEEVSGALLAQTNEELDAMEDLRELIERAIVEEPPLSLREGGFIRDGYSEEVDRLRSLSKNGKSWIALIEEKESEATGIKNLRIKYNKVFGYYLEVTNSYKDLVPDTWTRKQTLTNAERYITPELKELEDQILGAEDRLNVLEYELFSQLRDEIAGKMDRIQTTAAALARLDVFCSLSVVAMRNQYVRPQLNTEGRIEIKDGRHPVVELMIEHDQFVPNDAYLDNDSHRISIITGPNMAGKSTYMRQTALIVLMAQVGSFVPASSADIGIVDRIFTRVGASDDLASGQSTFMVEMTEVANILRNATRNSLLILDEIGRGTSTFDGLSIAWSVVEYIANKRKLGAKALFATHYHELTELEGKLDSVHNYCVAVKEQGDQVIFLRKIQPGGADRSYGIQVARLAGVPEAVLKRAREIADRLEDQDEKGRSASRRTRNVMENQLSFFDLNQAPDTSYLKKEENEEEEKVLAQLRDLDENRLTPMDALLQISAWKKLLKDHE
ncbi:MAG: DNA mismatch repair protein MutS [Lachnospiraceae bacterium]|nr:DNA mismatch repair protein MutS [Lachnospiraceae bacterium]